jgi:hypothetical protein
LTRQEYYTDLIETAKMNYEPTKDVEDDAIFIIPDKDNEDGEFSDGQVIWYPA